MKSARRIYDNGIETVTLGVFDSLFGNFYGVNLSFFKDLYSHFARNRFELFYRRGTIHVASDQKRFFALFFEI